MKKKRDMRDKRETIDEHASCLHSCKYFAYIETTMNLSNY